MEKEKQLLVRYAYTAQVSPDDWERQAKEKLFNLDATLREVNEWVVSSRDGVMSESGSNKRMVSITISEPE